MDKNNKSLFPPIDNQPVNQHNLGEDRNSSPYSARREKPNITTLDSNKIVKNFDFNKFVKLQLATLFSNNSGLERIKAGTKSKIKLNEKIITIEELNAQKNSNGDEMIDTYRALNSIPQQPINDNINPIETYENIPGIADIGGAVYNRQNRENQRDDNSQESDFEHENDNDVQIVENAHVVCCYIILSILFFLII